jgi:apolipoprotein N-acyltransferase
VQQSAVFEQSALVEQVRFLTIRTTYSKIGDVVAYAAMAVIAAGLIALRKRN